jgi:putative tricarboxylic transport membrane protein
MWLGVERCVGISLLGVAATTFWEAYRLLRVSHMKVLYGPATFPLLIGTGILVTGLCLLVSGGRKGTQIKKGFLQDNTWITMSGAMLAMILYGAILPFLGYEVSTFLTTIILLKVVGKYSWIKSIFSSVLITLVLWLIFTKLVYVPFPRGILY